MQANILMILLCVFSVRAKEDFKIPDSLIIQVNNGNAEIAYFIAKKLFDGSKEFKVDYDKGLVWLRKAAEMGYAHAMEELAYALDVEETEKEALLWYQKAAELGVGAVLGKIASFHYLGKGGLEKNCHTAYEWYKKAEIKEVELAFNNHAWSLATSPDKECRNPERALKVFSGLMAIYGENQVIPWFVWDTKAAVLASISDFGAAISLQEWIIAEMLENKLDVKNYQLHLDFYKLRKPWIDK